MDATNPDILGMTEADLAAEFGRRYGKGGYHARGTLRHLHASCGLGGLDRAPEFLDNPELAARIIEDFAFTLPAVERAESEGDTVKFTLAFPGGRRVEAVIVPMARHKTLCVSTQAGCARACAFCRTAAMGFVGNLTAGEIVAQYLTARVSFGAEIDNVVFMGMGEPFDNFDAVLGAIDILTDPRGPGLLPGRLSLSTCGHVAGLRRLASLAEGDRAGSGGKYGLVTVAVSLHSGIDAVRSSLMPVNRLWPLAALKDALLALPHSRVKDRLYFEYMVIPGVNDTVEAADALAAFLGGIVAKVNLIAFVAPEGSPLPSAGPGDAERFWALLRARGIPCFTRKGKGERIRASCGQLAAGKAAES